MGLIRQRVVASMIGGTLDKRLAAGSSPESDPLLACRAEYLQRPATRRRLAKDLKSLVAGAKSPRRSLAGPPPADARAKVCAKRQQLLELAERLDGPDAISVRDLAAAKWVLTEGSHLLWFAEDPGELDAILDRVPLVSSWT